MTEQPLKNFQRLFLSFLETRGITDPDKQANLLQILADELEVFPAYLKRIAKGWSYPSNKFIAILAPMMKKMPQLLLLAVWCDKKQDELKEATIPKKDNPPVEVLFEAVQEKDFDPSKLAPDQLHIWEKANEKFPPPGNCH